MLTCSRNSVFFAKIGDSLKTVRFSHANYIHILGIRGYTVAIVQPHFGVAMSPLQIGTTDYRNSGGESDSTPTEG